MCPKITQRIELTHNQIRIQTVREQICVRVIYFVYVLLIILSYVRLIILSYVRLIILSYVRSIIPCRIVEEEYGGIFAWGAVVDNKYVPVSVSPRRNHHRGQRVLSKDCLIYYMSIFCFLKYTQNELQLR